jgi:hypothetical protein
VPGTIQKFDITFSFKSHQSGRVTVFNDRFLERPLKKPDTHNIWLHGLHGCLGANLAHCVSFAVTAVLISGLHVLTTVTSALFSIMNVS